MPVTMTKLAVVAILGALAVFLGTLMLTLHVLVVQRQQHLILKEKRGGKVQQPEVSESSTVDVDGKDIFYSTISNSEPTEDIFLWKRVTPHDTSKKFAADAYWNQVKRYLGELGDVASGPYLQDAANTGAGGPPRSHIHTSLVQAAKQGKSDAQHYMASALASGIWLTGHEEYNSTSMPEDFTHVTPQTMLLWHMAALDGHVEAATAIGHRVQNRETECIASLPYFEVAAHSIMDELEAEANSRAKVAPPMDRHSLPEIHLHGGTSSQLAWDNKPDESVEAIQYYHLLSVKAKDVDVHAAYTLAHLYHFGYRGVQQNLTQALFYYEIAANADHWEAAGQAGKFHLWSLGMEPSERNVFKAHKLFQKGAPLGLDGCRERYREAQKLQTKGQKIEDTSVTVCDHPSLNGLGLLYLYGVPMILAINVEKARSYFQLARDMGNMDASYNLAMLRLGFKVGWKGFKDVNGLGQSTLTETVPSFMQKADNFPSKEDWQQAVQELQTAAVKGHLQARHRLGMIYQSGVKTGGMPYVSKDCKKASSYYQWVINNSSPKLSERTRMAYKQYMASDYEGALVNYLMAAETGHSQSQVNAAFLLERGVCLHLSEVSCRKASLRLWKAAAQAGDMEAALRVGDFYYFGSKRKITWFDFVLFPEVHVLPVVMNAGFTMLDTIRLQLGMDTPTYPRDDSQQQCEANEDGVCLNPDAVHVEAFDADLSKAAFYYRLAAQKHKSARANYNLGYMHEWGLGLSQDFPLAKRHYDLARAASEQATLAVQIALMTMNLHEQLKQMLTAWRTWNRPVTVGGTNAPTANSEGGNSLYDEDGDLMDNRTELTKLDVIVKHVVSWESLLIVLLTLILSRILQYRRTERR